MPVMYRTECNFGSKYFKDLRKAYKHFYRCVALGLSVEMWIITPAACGKTFQELIDKAYFH